MIRVNRRPNGQAFYGECLFSDLKCILWWGCRQNNVRILQRTKEIHVQLPFVFAFILCAPNIFFFASLLPYIYMNVCPGYSWLLADTWYICALPTYAHGHNIDDFQCKETRQLHEVVVVRLCALCVHVYVFYLLRTESFRTKITIFHFGCWIFF